MCVFSGKDTALSTCWTSVTQRQASAQLCVSASFCPLCLREEEALLPTESRWVSRCFYHPLVCSDAGLMFNLCRIPSQTFPESGLGDSEWREGARQQIQRSTSQPPEVWTWQFAFTLNGRQPAWRSQNLTDYSCFKHLKEFPSFL